jgi:molybdopterin molybdotransferase
LPAVPAAPALATARDNVPMARSLITIEEAVSCVLRSAQPLSAESLGVTDALDRVLASDVSAATDVPPFPCSAMDGYAILAGPAQRALGVVGESRAGAPWDRRLREGEAIRISTGAAVPQGATAVIRQEDVEPQPDGIRTASVSDPGENIRGAGEDMRAGTVVLRTGVRLDPAALAAAVAAGAGSVTVSMRPRVQVVCTGDELREPGEPLGPGEIHNSNAPMLVALAERCGALAQRARGLADDRSATESALADALEGADVVIVSGGVSVGPHDHVKPALGSLGVQELFWGVALQPGEPTWFGSKGSKLVFGLPGNPVSTFVTFWLFVSRALSALQGADDEPRAVPQASLAVPVRRNRHREQALRVRLERRDGALVAVPNGPQGSHIISSLLGADALAMIPQGEGELGPGHPVALTPLRG